MADRVGDIIGDYRAFVAQQHDRLLARGIDIGPYALSHLAVRVPEWETRGWVDTFGIDSPYDYDPVWAKAIEL